MGYNYAHLSIKYGVPTISHFKIDPETGIITGIIYLPEPEKELE